MTSVSIIKIAILAFYYRLVSEKKHRYVLYGTGAFIAAWTLAFIIVRVRVISFVRNGADICNTRLLV